MIRPVEVVKLENEPLTEFAIQLAKQNRDELGAVHCGVISGIVAQGVGTLRISRENDEPASMILTRHGLASDPRCYPIIAAAVCSDARRMQHGLSLVEAAADDAFARGRSFVQAICREDLPSNRFWCEAGFTPVAVRSNNSTRKISCIVWRRPIADMSTSLMTIERPRKAMGAGGRFVTMDDAVDQMRLFSVCGPEPSARHRFDQRWSDIVIALTKAGLTAEQRSTAELRYAYADVGRAAASGK